MRFQDPAYQARISESYSGYSDENPYDSPEHYRGAAQKGQSHDRRGYQHYHGCFRQAADRNSDCLYEVLTYISVRERSDRENEYRYHKPEYFRDHRKNAHSRSYKRIADVQNYQDVCNDNSLHHSNYDEFGNTLQETLRRTDIILRWKQDQYFIVMPQIREADVPRVIERIMGSWGRKGYFDRLRIKHAESVLRKDRYEPEK